MARAKKETTEDAPLTAEQQGSKAATEALEEHAATEGKLRDAQYDAHVAALNARLAEQSTY